MAEKRKRQEQRAGEEFDTTRIDFDPGCEALEDDDEAFREYLKKLPKAEAQARFQAAVTRRHEKQRRLMNSIFQFWIVCQDGACERNKSCAGNPHACFARWWPFVPERHKAHFRAYGRARADGGSHEEALRYAQAEVKRLAEHIAYVEAEQDAQLAALEAAERAQRGETALPVQEPRLPRAQQRGPRVSVL